MSFNHNKMDSNQFCRSVFPKLLIIIANVIKHFLCARHYFKHMSRIQSSSQHCKMGTILSAHFTGEKTERKDT